MPMITKAGGSQLVPHIETRFGAGVMDRAPAPFVEVAQVRAGFGGWAVG
ncbi:hypothetical protein [Salmonirosea aquatica]